MLYQITPQQLESLNAYLNGDEGASLDVDAARTVLAMAAALGTAIMKENRKLVSANASARRSIERMTERMNRKHEDKIMSEDFGETGLDSLDVANAALWCLQQKRYGVSKNKFMLLMYLVYGSFLYHHERRLFVESPVAIESGPKFWRINSKIVTVVTPVGAEAWTKLTAQNYAVAKFVKDYMEKWGDSAEESLKKLVLHSAPFKTAMSEAARNNKLAWTINDKDIWLWRDSQKK